MFLCFFLCVFLVFFSPLHGFMRGFSTAWLCIHICFMWMGAMRIWCQVSVKKMHQARKFKHKGNHCSITFTAKRKFFFHSCFIFCLPLPPSPFLPLLPCTVLGWRLKSLEWAHSSFNPSLKCITWPLSEWMALYLIYWFLCVWYFLSDFNFNYL